MKTVKAGAYFFLCFAAVTILVVCATVAWSWQEPARAASDQESVRLIASLDGHDLYRAYCAACHGGDARGNGPVTPALKNDPPDLTTIARKNAGIFPSSRVRNIIAGDEVIVAHGSREMPVWGPIFHQIERDRDYGNVRLDNLTKYLESIQRK